MSDMETLYEALASATVHDESGAKVGRVGQLFLDDQTHKPSWVTVKTGLLGGKETFVPLEGHDYHDGEIRVPYGKSFIEGAPGVGPDGHLGRDDEDQLYAYYRIDTHGAEARDQADPAHDFIPASQRDTDGGTFNNTAGLHEPRPGIDADRSTDHEGGIDKPAVPAAQAIPPEVGAHGTPPPRQGDGTSGYAGQGMSGQGASGVRLRPYRRG
ncbi:PRC-barrel domain-containing protein [Mariniluteicoccus flavus]